MCSVWIKNVLTNECVVSQAGVKVLTSASVPRRFDPPSDKHVTPGLPYSQHYLLSKQ